MPEVDYKKLVDDKFSEWSDLWARHSTDADLFNLVKNNSRVLDVNDHEVRNSIYIVLNDPADFAWRVESVLNSAVEQVEVTSDSKRFDTAYVERFIKAGFKAAEKLLALKGEDALNPFLDQQNFRRGSEAVRFYFHIEKGEMVPDIMPWDTGYFVCSNDNKGIDWTGYKSFRSKSQILTEHPEAEGKVKEGTELEVLYILSRDISELWVSGQLIKRLPNRLGYVPVVYRRVPMGSMLKDKGSMKYRGESGLFLIRDLIPELNRLVSIIQSLNLQELDHALQVGKSRETLSPRGAEIPTVDEVTAPGTVNEVEIPGRFEKMPIGEIRQQAQMLHQMIQSRIDRVMTNFEAFPSPKTATEILALMQHRETTILPRLVNRALLKQDGAEMVIKQTIAECEKFGMREVKIGGQAFEVGKLKGEYSIEFKYSFKDPRMDAARQALGTSQRGLIPDRDIRINTLQREDWQADEDQLRWEEAERLSPLIKLNRTRRAVGKAADDGEPGAEEELMMLTIQMIPALKQAMQGLMTPGQAPELEPEQPMMPVLVESRGGGRVAA